MPLAAPEAEPALCRITIPPPTARHAQHAVSLSNLRLAKLNVIITLIIGSASVLITAIINFAPMLGSTAREKSALKDEKAEQTAR